MISNEQIQDHNSGRLQLHNHSWDHLSAQLQEQGHSVNELVRKIAGFQVAVPSWALGTGGTRFGRFPAGGEPRSLEEKIADVGLIHALNRSSNSISLHIPWDIPRDTAAVKDLLNAHQLVIDSVNSNTFQDQKDQEFSYKFGSLCHTRPEVRKQAIDHNIRVAEIGARLGAECKTLTIWLADGSNFPGQHHFRRAYERTLDSLKAIYAGIPADWTTLVEYKPYEPHFYSMIIPDWGTSYSLCQQTGDRAQVLVDLGHHLPNTNIEQIVARLMHFGRLGGFHFNGSMYGDDDLTTGSIKPYQLFLIFNELVQGMDDPAVRNPDLAWMIDASHNTKDPVEDLLQSVQAIKTAYAKALLVDTEALFEAQEANEVVKAEEIVRAAFETDVRPLVAESRLQAGGALDPLAFFGENGIRRRLIEERGRYAVATGL
ncbi:L-rhamnose catabolism isomerase [Ravibacter arvi]|uniref:L-rhamnose catabolism isomerase n=1 Tax=Ravibacter arvi TaxID=2051041 RepID=A0ABP8M798_9BACT